MCETDQLMIKCESLSKQYVLENGTILTALEDIKLNILKGTFTGVVGKNGCGKTTLLKILSGIVKPSSGEACIYGKMLSVLDVGAGFHSELSGIENVFLVARQFGLNRKETEALLPDIIEFSEMEDFMQVPVKFYSQGMYLRLAISTVLLLNADIYLFDEVMAVGDASFQKKCLSKISELKEAGTTFMLVSHNFDQIAALCDNCIVLSHGHIICNNIPDIAFGIYKESLVNSSYQDPTYPIFRTLVDNFVSVQQFLLVSDRNNNYKDLNQTQELVFTIHWTKLVADCVVCFHIDILDDMDRILINTANIYEKDRLTLEETSKNEHGTFTEKCIIPAFFLNTGKYSANLKATVYFGLTNHQLALETEVPLQFEIKNYFDETLKDFWTYSPAPIRTAFKWQRS